MQCKFFRHTEAGALRIVTIPLLICLSRLDELVISPLSIPFWGCKEIRQLAICLAVQPDVRQQQNYRNRFVCR